MDLQEWDRKLLTSAPDLADYSLNYFVNNGVGYTGIVDEGIAAAAGFGKVCQGNWEVWCYTTTLFPKYGRQIHRAVKSMIEIFFQSDDVRRLQTSVDATHPKAERWVQKLGFEYEGTQRKYGPNGEDYRIYSRVKL
jgi:RimJ/RimL family protein N-acetyltransferase